MKSFLKYLSIVTFNGEEYSLLFFSNCRLLWKMFPLFRCCHFIFQILAFFIYFASGNSCCQLPFCGYLACFNSIFFTGGCDFTSLNLMALLPWMICSPIPMYTKLLLIAYDLNQGKFLLLLLVMF